MMTMCSFLESVALIQGVLGLSAFVAVVTYLLCLRRGDHKDEPYMTRNFAIETFVCGILVATMVLCWPVLLVCRLCNCSKIESGEEDKHKEL